jgi:DNA modification methylase
LQGLEIRSTSRVDLEASRVTKDEWREYTKTVWQIANVSHSSHPATFPIEIPRRLIKLFSFVGETVLDPFAGVGTTAMAALELDRNAIMIEQNPDYCALIKRTLPSAVVHVGDSRQVLPGVPEQSVALAVTSPPYWNKADYGSRPENLGNATTYTGFFRDVRPVFEECYRVLQPGRKLCVVTANVNQYTDHGLLTFPLATDFVVLLREIGFVMVNEIIWTKDGTGGKWGSWGVQRPIFGSYPYPPNFLFKNIHEYVLIFAKPNASPKKGPKVIPYADLMEAPAIGTHKASTSKNGARIPRKSRRTQ